MRARRFVVDTNVLISAALSPDGTSAVVVERAARNGRLLFSDATFEEFVSRLMRAKFDRWASRERRHAFVDRIKLTIEWIEINGRRMGCRDPDDDKVLETAFLGGAEVIISGDADLLAMHPFNGIAVLAPANWCD